MHALSEFYFFIVWNHKKMFWRLLKSIQGGLFMKKVLILNFIILLFSLLSACSTTTTPSEAYKGESQQQIYQAGKTALQDKNFGESIKRFEALDVQYPFGEETESAQFYLIYAYYMKEDYALSVAAADRFIREHPAYPHVDYAYFMRGMANYYQNMGILERIFSVDLATRDLTQIKKSYEDFNQLVTRFPNSHYAPAAHQYLIYLRNVMANHQLNVAEYYYDRKAYIAAANRAADVVQHYQGAPAVKKSLALLIKSYHQLGMTKLEEDAKRVQEYNGWQ